MNCEGNNGVRDSEGLCWCANVAMLNTPGRSQTVNIIHELAIHSVYTAYIPHLAYLDAPHPTPPSPNTLSLCFTSFQWGFLDILSSQNTPASTLFHILFCFPPVSRQLTARAIEPPSHMTSFDDRTIWFVYLQGAPGAPRFCSYK